MTFIPALHHRYAESKMLPAPCSPAPLLTQQLFIFLFGIPLFARHQYLCRDAVSKGVN